ncbi:MAG: Hsp33 family molecular chaperone HslO [Candidatus Accumulibacter sp.]|jgi:molecular chaperone Hsp33|nr:Hsp33 family molecular chaperone HslO [Accumulibacter sp.]
MSDYVRRFLFDALDIRGAVVRLDAVWQKLMSGRDYPAPVVELLGQMTATAALLADNLKHPGRLTVQLRGDGPVSHLVIDCSPQMNLRCMAHHVEGIAAAPVADLLGHGQLQLILETQARRAPHQSVVPLEGRTVAEIFERYLQRSEQLFSRFFLAASPFGAAGLYVQKMPATDQRDADGWTRIEALAATVKPEELLGLDGVELLTRLFHEETVRLFDARALTHDHPPDRDKVCNMLLVLGREEVYANIGKNGLIVIHDELSNHEYRFTQKDIDHLFSRTPETSKSVH